MFVVTGGAGFIGSNLVAGLAARGAEIVVCDFDDAATAPNIAKRGALERVDPAALAGWLDAAAAKPEAIFHMGAISSTVERDVDRVMRANYFYSLELWRWCAAHDVPFIYASSAATYGSGAHQRHSSSE